MTLLDLASKVDQEPIFNCSNPTYHHEVVIILVSHIIAVVVEIIQHNTNEFPTHNWWSILTRVDTAVPMHVFEVLKKK
jgi:hypothetical protein